VDVGKVEQKIERKVDAALSDTLCSRSDVQSKRERKKEVGLAPGLAEHQPTVIMNKE
jgi:hypothetical protein